MILFLHKDECIARFSYLHECTFKYTLRATKIAFSSIVLRKERRNINESRTHFNAKLRNFCEQNNIAFIDNGNINESHLGMKKLHLNGNGNSLLAKNLLNYVEKKCLVFKEMYIR